MGGGGGLRTGGKGEGKRDALILVLEKIGFCLKLLFLLLVF